MTELTAAERRKVERQLDKMRDIHSCPPSEWTGIVSTPGFFDRNPDGTVRGQGRTEQTCDVCRPMIVELYRKLYGDVDVDLRTPEERRAARERGEP